MKNRCGAEYYWEQISDKEYRFVMDDNALSYCRMGGKRGQETIDANDLSMFDPSGGPYVAVGSGIFWDEIKGAEKQDPLIVTHIRYDGDNFIVRVGE